MARSAARWLLLASALASLAFAGASPALSSHGGAIIHSATFAAGAEGYAGTWTAGAGESGDGVIAISSTSGQAGACFTVPASAVLTFTARVKAIPALASSPAVALRTYATTDCTSTATTLIGYTAATGSGSWETITATAAASSQARSGEVLYKRGTGAAHLDTLTINYDNEPEPTASPSPTPTAPPAGGGVLECPDGGCEVYLSDGDRAALDALADVGRTQTGTAVVIGSLVVFSLGVLTLGATLRRG